MFLCRMKRVSSSPAGATLPLQPSQTPAFLWSAGRNAVANALPQALAMPLKERRARHEALYAKVCEYDVNRWQQEFLAALGEGGREHERFQSYAELTKLRTSGAPIAPSAEIEN